MSLTDDIRQMLREHRQENRRPIRIEIGRRQAEALAVEWAPRLIQLDPVLCARFEIAPPGEPEPVTAEQVYEGGTLYGVRFVGVGDDHLAVTAEDRR